MQVDPLSGFADFGTLLDSPLTAFVLVFRILYQTSFVWLPLALTIAVARLWLTWKQAEFLKNQKPTLLEIRLPQDVFKSPQAMELFYTAIYQTGGEGTWIDKYWKGKSRPWFSLELVSLGGQIRFFIWTRSAWKNYIEAQLYAQFAGVEVYEVEDYTLPVKFDPDKVVLWGCEFKLTKSDPFPIRTYLDNPDRGGFGMVMFPGTPTMFQIDPMSNTLEYLGTLKPGEQAWIQILIRAHKKDRKKKGTWFGEADWKQDLEGEMEKILKKDKLTKFDNTVIDALERSVSKFPFETGIRALYISEKSTFNPVSISGLTGSFRQYNSNNLNGFAPTRGLTIFDYPWQDYKEIRQNGVRRSLLDAYKRRSYFLPPYKSPHFILNTEELATIYHFPSATVTTPTLQRVPSKKAEPPPDLPI